MKHILSEIFPFLESVFAHWQIWLSGGGLGGIVVLVLALTERLTKWSMSRRAHVGVFIVAFFVCACFLSWVDKDDSLQAARKDLQNQKQQFSSELEQAHNDYGALQAKCQYQSGVVDTLGKQNRDQQNTINHCQQDAIKLIAPPPEHHAIIQIFQETPPPGFKLSTFLFTTNRVLTPTTITASCDRPVRDFEGFVSGTKMMISSPAVQVPNSPPDRNWEFAISTPPWTPDTPIVIEFAYEGTQEPLCVFNKL